MFAGVVFILAISVVAFADDASVGTALVLPEEKMQMFRDAWERYLVGLTLENGCNRGVLGTICQRW